MPSALVLSSGWQQVAALTKLVEFGKAQMPPDAAELVNQLVDISFTTDSTGSEKCIVCVLAFKYVPSVVTGVGGPDEAEVREWISIGEQVTKQVGGPISIPPCGFESTAAQACQPSNGCIVSACSTSALWV